MTTWTLKNLHKKSAVEKQFWYKDGATLIRYEGWRWGEFYCESDEQPEIDLKNPDGYNLSDSDYDWELAGLDDGHEVKPVRAVARHAAHARSSTETKTPRNETKQEADVDYNRPADQR